LDLSPALWLDAADTATITESSGAVSQWDNKGSLGNFAQATAANQPTTGASTVNGLNVLDFAGDWLDSQDATSAYKFGHDGTTYLIAAVWKPGATANPDQRLALCGTGIATNQRGFCIRYDDISPENDALEYFVQRGVSGSRPVEVVTNSFFAPAQFQIFTSIADPDNATAADRLSYFINGGGANNDNTQTASVSTLDPSNAFQVGAAGGNNSPLTGAIAELVIVSGANATELAREELRDYLNAKWSVY
jgi:hypothetical protein